jgi:hypothetical protein
MNIFDTFKNITRFDIQSYFEDFSSFVLSDYQSISAYYQTGTPLTSDTILKVNDLMSRMAQINDLFFVYGDRLSATTVEVWEMLDFFESTKVTLLTIVNSSRWLRSTKNVLRSNAVSNDFILRQQQSLEQLASEIGSGDATNDWSQIAITNNLKEEDYSFEGGNKLKISFTNNLNYFVNSVIDSISGEKLYGLDIDRNFYFENNDLAVLGYRDNINQQTLILLGLVKGSVPEFPQDGIDKNLISSNVNAIQYPMILRQQSLVFEKDDRYKAIAVSGFSHLGEALIIDMQITTKLDDVLDEKLVLQP